VVGEQTLLEPTGQSAGVLVRSVRLRRLNRRQAEGLRADLADLYVPV